MGMNQSTCFVCIGAGNVATHLVRKLCSEGFDLMQVYSRTGKSARLLADTYKAGYTTTISKILTNADFYLVALPDLILPGFFKEFKTCDKLIVHTAGSIGLEVFGEKFRYPGVMYPLQTFTRNIELDLVEVPFLIEAGDKKTLLNIKRIARIISKKVYITDSETRKWIHLAAVFACNFTNHMLVASSEILQYKNLDPEILKPLIEETFRKSLTMNPAEAQTGPAVRNDTNTINKHIKMLENQALLQKIYTFTSRSIQNTKSTR